MTLSVRGVPAFSDNYLWLLDDGSQAVVVDPGDATPVLRALDEQGLALSGILVTHHHFDHTGGIEELLARFDVPVLGPADPRIPQVTQPLSEGQRCEFLGVAASILEVPGHTSIHIAYFIDDPAALGAPALFCGDTLFAGGCGRLFEGSPAQMRHSLEKLAQLPANTLVYCAHEYTQANLRFARAVEPANAELASRAKEVDLARAANQPTVPSTMAVELDTNPFLRWQQPDVITAAAARKQCPAGQMHADDVFAAIRQWKDNF